MGCGGGGDVAGFVGVRGVQGEVYGAGHPGAATGSASETRSKGTAGRLVCSDAGCLLPASPDSTSYLHYRCT